MKRMLAVLVALLLISVVAYVSRAVPPITSDERARAAALKLFQSLADEQKKLAVKEFTDKDRYTEQFPEVTRPGLPYSKLTAEQKEMVDGVIKAMTSEYGAKRCLEVAKQSSDKGRYINFFGAPTADKPFAWRLASHHLTLIYAEFGENKADEFGPILLGGNPVKDLWEQEEKIIIELYGSLSEAEAKSIQAKGISAGSGSAIGKAGIKVADLNEKSRALARKLLSKRLDVFSADRRNAAEAIIEREGGVDGLRIALWGTANKSHLDGGSYHWRIGSDAFVADWQTAGKNHIHMTVRGKAKPAVK